MKREQDARMEAERVQQVWRDRCMEAYANLSQEREDFTENCRHDIEVGMLLTRAGVPQQVIPEDDDSGIATAALYCRVQWLLKHGVPVQENEDTDVLND